MVQANPNLVIELIDENVLLFSFLAAGKRVECLTNFARIGSERTLPGCIWKPMLKTR